MDPEELLLRKVLRLYRRNEISLGRAAELSGMAIESFMVLARTHGATIHYGLRDLEEDRAILERLSTLSSR
jgi:predicted HTH domain antitoxin